MSRYDPLTPATPYLGLVSSTWPVVWDVDTEGTSYVEGAGETWTVDEPCELRPCRRGSGRGCDAPGCERPHMALGLCSIHYDRRRAAECATTNEAPTTRQRRGGQQGNRTGGRHADRE